MPRSPESLLQKIAQSIQKAKRAENALENIQRLGGYQDAMEEPDDEFDEAAERLTYACREAFRDLRILAEALGLNGLREELLATEAKLGNLSDLSRVPREDDLYSEARLAVQDYHESLQALVDPDHISQLSVLETILDNTRNIIISRKIEASNEISVRNAVLEVIQYAFRSAFKEVQLPGIIKTYRGDIGIPELDSVIEYKYADSDVELKSCLDGIYADMFAYGESRNWRHFYAVFYLTGPFTTQRTLEKEFDRVGAKANWTPIVIDGTGKRLRKSAKNGPVPIPAT